MDSLAPDAPVPEPSVQDDTERPDAPNILEHVEAQRLSPYARLALLVALCEQVERLHAAGDVHRLLRPDVIHVTEDGHPDLVTGPPGVTPGLPVEQLLSDVSRLTDTVPYLAPEQLAEGLGAGDARSDVYALGVIGFEMLAGRTPRALSPVTKGGVTQIVPEETAARLGVVDRRYRGLLDSIFDRAVDRDPEQRAASAGAFARELRDALDRGAVPGARTAPVRTGWQRPAAVLAAAGIVLVASTSLMFWSTQQVRQARYETQRARTARAEATAERDQARAAADQAEQRAQEADAARARAERDRGTERQRRALAEAARGAAESMRDVAFVSGTIWGLTRAPGSDGTRPAGDADGERFRANAGAAIAPGRPETLVKEDRERRSDADPRRRDLEQATEVATAEVQTTRDRATRAERRAAQAQTDLRAERRAVEAVRDDLRRERNRANELSRQVAELSREVESARNPTMRAVAESRAAAVAALDDFLVAGLFRQATARAPYGQPARVALDDAAARLGGAFPRDPLVEAIIALRLARSYLAINLPDLARPLAHRAMTVRREVLGADHWDVGEAMEVLVDAEVRAGVLASAERTARDLLEVRRRTLGVHREVARSLERLAEVQQAQGETDRAARLLEEAVLLRKQLDGPEHPSTLDAIERLAAIRVAQGRHDDAERSYVMALDIRRRVHDEDDERVHDTIEALADFLLGRGRYEEAGDLYAELVTLRERGAAGWRTARARSGLGAALVHQELFAVAEPALLAAFEGLWESEAAPESVRRVAVERLALMYERMGETQKSRRWRALLP
jgi:tetratricopeptide (TPR) repeat protein